MQTKSKFVIATLAGLVSAGLLGTVALAAQPTSDPDASSALAARGVQPDIKVCDEIRRSMTDVASENAKQLTSLKTLALQAKDTRVKASFSLKKPTTTADAKKRAGSIEVVALSASFSNFVGGTNLNSDYPFDSSLTYEQNVSKWQDYLLQILAAQQTSNSQLPQSERPDAQLKLYAIKKRVASGQIDVIGGSLNGKGSDVNAFLVRQNDDLYGIAAGETPAVLPPDDATRTIETKVCGSK